MFLGVGTGGGFWDGFAGVRGHSRRLRGGCAGGFLAGKGFSDEVFFRPFFSPPCSPLFQLKTNRKRGRKKTSQKIPPPSSRGNPRPKTYKFPLGISGGNPRPPKRPLDLPKASQNLSPDPLALHTTTPKNSLCGVAGAEGGLGGCCFWGGLPKMAAPRQFSY